MLRVRKFWDKVKVFFESSICKKVDKHEKYRERIKSGKTGGKG
jgi:hypothetical protein